MPVLPVHKSPQNPLRESIPLRAGGQDAPLNLTDWRILGATGPWGPALALGQRLARIWSADGWASAYWASEEARAELALAGLASVSQVMASEQGQRLRRVADRENRWFFLMNAQGIGRGVFLKRHYERNMWTRLQAWMGFYHPGPGPLEAANVLSLIHHGVPTMKLLACGERLHRNGSRESFVMTEELEGYCQFDHYLRQRFPRLHSGPLTADDRALRRLIVQIARIARQFHDAGFNHRDFYTCHFFVKETAPGEFDVRLIDLQRMQSRRWLRRRWIVKDLAQLAYSALPDRLDLRHKLIFLKAYLGVSRLSSTDRKQARRILARKNGMQRRLGSY